MACHLTHVGLCQHHRPRTSVCLSSLSLPVHQPWPWDEGRVPLPCDPTLGRPAKQQGRRADSLGLARATCRTSCVRGVLECPTPVVGWGGHVRSRRKVQDGSPAPQPRRSHLRRARPGDTNQRRTRALLITPLALRPRHQQTSSPRGGRNCSRSLTE